MEFTDKLSELLKERELTRKQFLSDLKFGKSQFTYWEKSGSLPNPSTLNAIAQYFAVPVDYLTGNTDDIHPALKPPYEASELSELSEQEKTIICLFRSTTENGRLEMISALVNIKNSATFSYHLSCR